jgi:septum site-determining protein MinC
MSSSTHSPAETSPTPASFRLKAGLYPLTLLEIQRCERSQFERDLRAKVAEAPAFFQQAPVILSVETDAEPGAGFPLAELLAMCRRFGLIPVALRGGSDALQQQALSEGMALMPEGRSKALKDEPRAAPKEAPEEPPQAAPAKSEVVRAETSAGPSKIITTPIRSGQQVYAAGGDLIILSSVSPGAEVLADGNIHVYGRLRGRALAGVHGNTNARIFCQRLEAELISIAGDFKMSDDLRSDPLWEKAVQISHNEQTLTITALA